MSGASGKILSAIHLSPEACEGGPIGKIKDGDMIRLDATNGRLDVMVDATEFSNRKSAEPDLSSNEKGLGRELFANFRRNVTSSLEGASAL
jgi:phosphogluconate dehydratase